MTPNHIEWLANALLGINKNHKDLTISIGKLKKNIYIFNYSDRRLSSALIFL